jgi:hypothetical protein
MSVRKSFSNSARRTDPPVAVQPLNIEQFHQRLEIYPSLSLTNINALLSKHLGLLGLTIPYTDEKKRFGSETKDISLHAVNTLNAFM